MFSFQGAVALRMRIYDRIMCFVNCHFAAHIEAVNRRNADFDHVYRSMVFSRPSNGTAAVMPYLLLPCFVACFVYLSSFVYRCGLPLALCLAVGISSAAQILRGPNVCKYCLALLLPRFTEQCA